MSELRELKCQRCGGELQVFGNIYKCSCCGKAFEKSAALSLDESIRRAIDEQKNQQVANLRQLLWREVNREYISNSAVAELCNKILAFLPNDFYANFYLATCAANRGELANFLYGVDIQKHYCDIPDMLEYLIKGLKAEWSLCVGDFIERAFKGGDLKLYNKYRTLFEEQNAKVEEGVFEPSIRRDVFIAYSSADLKKVESLVGVLESENLTCFVAARNLRHGSGAADSYEAAIQTAINSCSALVFVSSENSRSIKCDAFKELNYIKTHRPDMLRVQYLLNDYSGKASDRNFKEFFEGLEYCTTEKDVAERVTLLIMGGQKVTADIIEEGENEEYGEVGEDVGIDIDEEEKSAKKARIKAEKKRRAEESKRAKAEKKRQSKERKKRLKEEKRRKKQPNKGKAVTAEQKKKRKKVIFYSVAAVVLAIVIAVVAVCVYISDLSERDYVTIDGITYKRLYEEDLLDVYHVYDYEGDSETVTIPSKVLGKEVLYISVNAFKDCTNLKSVEISEGISSIAYCAFISCTSLESVIIPSSVKRIGDSAFSGCTSLTSVTFGSTSGWYVNPSMDLPQDEDISVSVSDPTIAAQYLTDTYCSYYWHK